MTETATDRGRTDAPDFAIHTERCRRCGESITATSLRRLQKRYTKHAVEEHDRPENAGRRHRTRPAIGTSDGQQNPTMTTEERYHDPTDDSGDRQPTTARRDA